jgi:hypothetical protein
MAAFTKKLCMYSNVVKTDMILIYGECKKNASAIARLCIFLKTLRFFQNFLRE